MTYEFENLIVNIFTAIGTCGAAGTALWLARPKKEKATGDFKFSSDKISNCCMVELQINNIGTTNIRIDYEAGAVINSKGKNEHITFPDDSNYKTSGLFFISKKKSKSINLSIRLDINSISSTEDYFTEMYKDNKCTLSVYTVKGTEIELKKFSNKDPLGIGKKKEIAVGK